MSFSRQYWSVLPCPPPVDLPDTGIQLTSLMSPELVGEFFITRATWEANRSERSCKIIRTGMKKQAYLLWTLAGTRKYLQQLFIFLTWLPHLPLCCRKDGPLSCQSGGFPTKISIPSPQQLVFQFTGLLCSEQSKLGLSNFLTFSQSVAICQQY